MNAKLQCQVGTVGLNTPLIPASGVWPMEKRFWSSPYMDACCTKGLTLNPKLGNSGTRICETPSGLLNSIGLENPGLRAWIATTLPMLKETGKKIVLNLSFSDLKELSQSLELINAVQDQICALELNLSCPNVEGGGASWGTCSDTLEVAVLAARKEWAGPLWVKLTPQAENFVDVAEKAQDAGADALVAANTWLGMALDSHFRPVFQRKVAGNSGPAVFPLALRLVFQTAARVTIPIIGCGGVASGKDALDMIAAGASAVMVGSSFFRNMNQLKEITDSMLDLMEGHKVNTLAEFVGIAHR